MYRALTAPTRRTAGNRQVRTAHFSLRDEHIVKKIGAYIILGINDEGRKEVWTMPLRNWGKVYGELSIMYDGRLF